MVSKTSVDLWGDTREQALGIAQYLETHCAVYGRSSEIVLMQGICDEMFALLSSTPLNRSQSPIEELLIAVQDTKQSMCLVGEAMARERMNLAQIDPERVRFNLGLAYARVAALSTY